MLKITGLMVVSLTPNVPLATVMSSTFYGIWTLLAGFVIPAGALWDFFAVVSCPVVRFAARPGVVTCSTVSVVLGSQSNLRLIIRCLCCSPAGYIPGWW